MKTIWFPLMKRKREPEKQIQNKKQKIKHPTEDTPLLIKLDNQGSFVRYFEHFIPPEESNKLFKKLLNEIPWQQSQISMYGKKINLPRLQCAMSDNRMFIKDLYLKSKPLEWSPEIKQIKEKIECVTNCKFNYVLLNLYRNGKDYINFHSDR